MEKANIHILLIEELTDLLYELNTIYNLERECTAIAHGEHFHFRLMKVIFYTAFAIELASQYTDTPRDMNEMVRDIVGFEEAEGFVDNSDLAYSIEKALTHITRMNLAYEKELENPTLTLLQVIQLCLTDTDYLIYGDSPIRTIQSDPIPNNQPAVGDL